MLRLPETMSEARRAIFLHSLFRSGSTYFFDVFRRSADGYWCYQEPENEILLQLAKTDDPLADTEQVNEMLRHPRLNKPYLAEYFHIRNEIGSGFSKNYCYDDYFLTSKSESPGLKNHLDLLMASAQGRPVLQFCRSSGRFDWLRAHFDATHLYLWRNPWDQWWSYKVTPYFNTANLLILNALNPPAVFVEIRKKLGFQPYANPDIDKEFEFFSSHGLGDTGSYFLFFSLWYHALYEGLRLADYDINIDELSESLAYRREVTLRLEKMGVTALDLSDCQVHRGCYSRQDADFFIPIETQVIQLFQQHGYDGQLRADITQQLNEFRNAAVLDKADAPRQPCVEDVRRLRVMVRRHESEVANMRRLIWDQRLELDRLARVEAELRSIYESRLWEAIHPFLRLFWAARSVIRRRLKHVSGSP